MGNIKDNKYKINNINPLFVLKVGIGSALAIIVAEALDLKYSPSAGIITLLTVQSTRKETLLIALKRIYSFLLAANLSYILFEVFGYNPIVFGCFVLLFVALSLLSNLKDGISMNAVLITHFLIEKKVDFDMYINELLLLVIGMGIGILINLIMPNYKKWILLKQHMLEEEMKKLLKVMARALKDKKACLIQDEPYDKAIYTNKQKADAIVINFRDIDALTEELINKTYEDAGNTLLSNTRYLLSYLEMRKHQIEVLKVISRSIMDIPVVLKQSIPLATFLENTSDSFHELNDVKGLLEQLRELSLYYKQEKLPVTREEFEYRAILFKILNELEHFLLIKRNFILEYENKS